MEAMPACSYPMAQRTCSVTTCRSNAGLQLQDPLEESTSFPASRLLQAPGLCWVEELQLASTSLAETCRHLLMMVEHIPRMRLLEQSCWLLQASSLDLIPSWSRECLWALLTRCQCC